MSSARDGSGPLDILAFDHAEAGGVTPGFRTLWWVGVVGVLMVPVTSQHLLSSAARGSTSSVIRDLLRLIDQPGMLSLAGGLPASELLPTHRIAEAATAVLGRDSARSLQYSPSEGMVELREAVAGRYGESRLDAADFLITTGSQQGIDLVMRALLDPGDVAVVQAPSYLGALQAVRTTGARLQPVRGDADGLDVDELAGLLTAGLRPKVVYVVTEFANPDGATLSAARRSRLAGLAEHYGFVVIEDNPYGELRWGGDQPPPMWTLTDMAATLGSASKVLSPGLRVGWLRAPSWLFAAVAKLKQATDLHTSSLDQLIVADVLADRRFMAAHLDVVRTTYRRRARVLLDALDRGFRDDLTVQEPDGGMFLWATLARGMSASALFDRAIDCRVAFVPGGAFSVAGEAQSSLRLCFTTLDEPSLVEAANRLVRAHSSLARAGVRDDLAG